MIKKDAIQLIDLREEYEFEDGSICDTNIPMAEVFNRLDEIASNKEVVMFCKSGKRSSSMVYMLKKTRLKSSYSSRRWSPSLARIIFCTNKQLVTLILKGIAMGAANVIPGVSGGTIALITNIYEDLVNALKSCVIRQP